MKKTNSLIIAAILAVILIAGCKKEANDITVTASKTTAAVNEEITFTINDPEHYESINWKVIDSTNTEIHSGDGSPNSSFISTISGGGDSDFSWVIKISNKGTYVVAVWAFDTYTNPRSEIEIVIQ